MFIFKWPDAKDYSLFVPAAYLCKMAPVEKFKYAPFLIFYVLYIGIFLRKLTMMKINVLQQKIYACFCFKLVSKQNCELSI